MTKIVAVEGKAGSLTPHAKRLIAVSMYEKGKAFVGASILVRGKSNSEATDYVLLYLLCQGVEVTLKGLLLLNDYDRFRKRLKKFIGHDLLKVANEASTAYGLNPLRDALEDELQYLSNLYSDHFLRYGTRTDLFIDPRSVQRGRVFRRLAAVLRLAERELKRS